MFADGLFLIGIQWNDYPAEPNPDAPNRHILKTTPASDPSIRRSWQDRDRSVGRDTHSLVVLALRTGLGSMLDWACDSTMYTKTSNDTLLAAWTIDAQSIYYKKLFYPIYCLGLPASGVRTASKPSWLKHLCAKYEFGHSIIPNSGIYTLLYECY